MGYSATEILTPHGLDKLWFFFATDTPQVTYETIIEDKR